MTFFREAFTKDRKEALSYDDSATLFFFGTILFLIVTIWTISFFHDLFCPLKKSKTGNILAYILCSVNRFKYCCCKECVKKINLKKNRILSLRNRLFRQTKIVQIFCLGVLYILVYQLIQNLSTASEIQAFQPFEILNIKEGVNETLIRKAYRRMSLLHHPDRHPTDPQATARFMLITKAYHALTDETARKNYEKYGNPDGPGVFQIGIGLPQYLVKEEYQTVVLFLFVFLVIFIIPSIFILYYHHQNNFFRLYINESIRFKRCVELFSASAESRSMEERKSDAVFISKIQENLTEKVGKSRFPSPLIERNMTLLLGHMERKWDLMSPELEADLHSLLHFVPGITNSMIEIAFLRNWYPVIRSILELRRCLTQAIMPTSAVLKQVPHYNELTSDIKKKYNPCLKAFIHDVRQEDKSPGSIEIFSKLPGAVLNDIKSFCSSISLMELDVKVFVEGEKEMVENDLVTFQITLTRHNLHSSEKAGLVHAPFIHSILFEEWWIFLLDKKSDGLLSYKRSKSLDNHFTENLNVLLPTSGTYMFQVIAMCDSYSGLDVVKDVQLTVRSKEEVKRKPLVNQQLEDNEEPPTLFQVLFGDNEDTVSDDLSND
ncbi:uncharacterized protein LOC128883435 isoform X2 [Hylaeus volcanicus]|uniref:uncharacterized protein LOC128883435 isoform X2 n=1 Tax=Hylaeus volcanicus TaxID=313075 RepID=UPI0023B7811E|nr:uncharacterized protein LOC128883435 isoform X2 [Hylaeus volcanicus]